MNRPAPSFYEFGPFHLDPLRRRLLLNDTPVPLTPKAFELLLVLIERREKVIGKDELIDKLWPDTVVEEANLTVNMSALRKALGENPSEHRYIVTVPGRGYRFVAAVSEVWDEASDLIVEEHRSASIIIEQEDDGEIERQRDGETEREEEAEGIKERRVISPAPHLSLPSALPPSLPLSVPPSSALSLPSARSKFHPGTMLAVAGVLVVAITAVGYFWIWGRSKSGTEAVKSIAVLPFKPLDADQTEDYLGLGMADALITRLSNLQQIIVRPTSAVRKYHSAEYDLLTTGRELRVEAVLEGSIQRLEDRVRVTVQIVSVADGRPLWAQKFDEKFTDIFTIEDSISRQVAEALALELTGADRARLAKRNTENGDAYQAYLKGRYYWNQRTPDSLKKGIDYFRQAIAHDPRYAAAYAGLADSYTLLGIQEVILPKQGFQEARAAATKALEIDPQLSEAQTSLAHISLHGWNLSAANQEFKRALELNPHYSNAHHWQAEYFSALGRGDEAVAAEKRSLEIDPLSLIISTDLGWHLYFARRYDEAIAQYRQTLELDRNFALAHLRLGQVYAQTRKYQEAIAELTQAVTLSGRSTEAVSALGRAYALAGEREKAQVSLDELKGRAKQGYVSPYFIAQVYVGLDDYDQAFAWLEKAYEDGSGWLVFINAEPQLAGLIKDQRFADLLRRVGLQP